MAKNAPKMTKNDVVVKKMTKLNFFLQIWSLFDCLRVEVQFSSGGGLNELKFWSCRREILLMGSRALAFSTSYMT